MIIEYHPSLEGDLKEISAHYESKSQGLGAAFVDEFERQVRLLAATPTRWMVVEKDTRRCLMSRFPYIIYFHRISESMSYESVDPGRYPK